MPTNLAFIDFETTGLSPESGERPVVSTAMKARFEGMGGLYGKELRFFLLALVSLLASMT